MFLLKEKLLKFEFSYEFRTEIKIEMTWSFDLINELVPETKNKFAQVT